MAHLVSLFHGSLGCSHFLAIMNNVAMNICVAVLLVTYFDFSLGGCLGMELLGHMVILALTL